MPMRNSGVISIATRSLVTLVILAIGIGLSVIIIKAKPAIPRRKNTDSIKQVYIMEAQRVAVGRIWDGFGTAVARDQADIPSELTGMVVKIPDDLRPGSRVIAGQAIAILDDADVIDRETISQNTISRLHAQISALAISEESARDQLLLAEDELAAVAGDYQRALDSFKQGGASQSEVDGKRRLYKSTARIVSELKRQLDLITPQRDELNASVAEEESRLAMILHDRERCIIKSPLTGILQTLDINVGEQVTPGKRIARVVRLNRIEIPLRFAASARSSIHAGDSVTLTNVGAVPLCWTAEVRSLSPDTDPETRTFIVYAELTQEESDKPYIVPGMFVRASLSDDQSELQFIVPRRAILDDVVWIINEKGLAERRPVKVLYHVVGSFPRLHTPDTQWAVLDGTSDIAVGDHVILTNIQELVPGMKIRGTDSLVEIISPHDDDAINPADSEEESSASSG